MTEWMLAGAIDDAKALAFDITDLLTVGVVGMLCAFFVAVTGFRTQSPLKTFVAAVGAAAVMAVVVNMTILSDKFGDDIRETHEDASAVVVIDERDAR